MLFAVFVSFDKHHFFLRFSPFFVLNQGSQSVDRRPPPPRPADGQIFVGKSYKPKVNF